MIPLILSHLRDAFGLKVPNVFFYTSTRMMLAAVVALVISIFLGPKFIKKLYELKIGQPIRSEDCPLLGELHAKKKDTPTMGGLLILFSIIIAAVMWMDMMNVFTLLLMMATVLLGVIGGVDDYLKLKYKNSKGLSGRMKLLGQIAVSAVVAIYLLNPMIGDLLEQAGVRVPVIKEESIEIPAKPSRVPLQEYASRIYVPFIKDPILTFTGIFTLLAFLFIVFVITGSSNAVNLTDGLDGLAAGCLLMVAVCLAIIAFLSNHIELSRYLNIVYVEGSGEIAVYLSAFAGACLGFLWYNGHPAQVFMGDTGSLALGGGIGVSAVLLKRELLLAIIGGIFVAEVLSVIAQVASFKLRNKKRVLLCAPLHHHFEYKGWHETKVVIRFWIIAFLLAIIGMASIKFQ